MRSEEKGEKNKNKQKEISCKMKSYISKAGEIQEVCNKESIEQLS